MKKIKPESSKEFVGKVKELLEAITRKPYLLVEKENLEKSIWAIVLNEDKINIGENKGAYWVQEEKDSTIRLYSDRFFDVDDVASEEYNPRFLIEDDLLERKNWEKYRKKVPGLIAELEAAERIANEANEKYGTNIKLWASEKPNLSTSFNAKGMSEDEKLHEIEKHARAIREMWELWREWAKNVGREIYMKTTKKRLSRFEYIEKVMSRLRDITRVAYSEGKKEPEMIWVIVGDPRNEKNIVANRGVWFTKETRDSIVMLSDNLNTVKAKSIEEHRLMERWSKGDLSILGPKDELKETIIHPELIEKVTEQVSKEFKVKIRLSRDRPVMETTFRTVKLGPYGKLYEIERHAKALAEAWDRITYIIRSKKVK